MPPERAIRTFVTHEYAKVLDICCFHYFALCMYQLFLFATIAIRHVLGTLPIDRSIFPPECVFLDMKLW